MLYDALIAFSWLTWLPYGFLTGAALLGEGRTLFSNAGFGFVYITLGMPAYLVAWLGLVIYAGIRSVPTSWLARAFAGAVLIVIGCANIG